MTLRSNAAAAVIACGLLLSGASALAQETTQSEGSGERTEKDAPPPAPTPSPAPSPTLSSDDEELVNDLDLLEHLDEASNLDLLVELSKDE